MILTIVMYQKIILKKFCQADRVFIKVNPHSLRMTAVITYLLISRLAVRAVRIACFRLDYAFKLIKILLHSPEAPAGKINCLHTHSFMSMLIIQERCRSCLEILHRPTTSIPALLSLLFYRVKSQIESPSDTITVMSVFIVDYPNNNSRT